MVNKKEKAYTTFTISRICGVYPTTVANWIDKGSLKAFITPGGHRRVERGELFKFLKKYNVTAPQGLIVRRRRKRKRILVVDDDNNVMKSIVKILENSIEKYEILTARDGFQAGQLVSDFKPEIVVLDIMLPGVDGFSVCAEIKKRSAAIKILAITGFDSPETRE
ncbi:response regulator, partial [bacterium]|nr:response regulator [bacterium]